MLLSASLLTSHTPRHSSALRVTPTLRVTHTCAAAAAPPDVSDAGNGGQVLMDESTFKAIKEDLRPLGAVGPGGINFNK